MPATKARAKPAAADKGAGNLKWLIAVTVALGTFMDVLDNSSVSVALQHIGGSLGASQDDVTWVITSLLLAEAVMLPLAGFLATAIGRTRLFSGALVLYGISSLLCGLSSSLAMLLMFRVCQGLCGGVIPTMAQAILKDSFPDSQRGQAFALFGVATVVAPTIGPLLCGWLVDTYSWHWVFFVNVPVAFFAAFMTTVLVKDPPELLKAKAAAWAKGLRLDVVGLGLLALGLSSLQFVLSRGERNDWFGSGLITGLAILAGVLLVGGIFWETRAKNPILDLSLFRSRTFAASILIMFVVGILLYGSSTQLPQFLQSLLGYRPVDAGLVITPGGLLLIGLLPVVGWLTGKVQARWLIMLGMGISSLAFFHYAHVLSTVVDFRSVAEARMLQALGLGFLFVPINVAAYVGLAKAKTNQAATFINLAQTIGGGFGIAAIETIVARRSQFHQSRLIDGLVGTNADYTSSLQQLGSTAFNGAGSAVDALQHAQAVVLRSVQQQATTIAYDDAFWVLSMLCLCVMPLVFLMKPNKPGAPESGAGAA
ncbi:MAG: DHA2 family efflux MFS transporter permease subunit [Janthinobacterium lividum]